MTKNQFTAHSRQTQTYKLCKHWDKHKTNYGTYCLMLHTPCYYDAHVLETYLKEKWHLKDFTSFNLHSNLNQLRPI